MSNQTWELSQKVGNKLKLKKLDAVIMYREGKATTCWYGEYTKGALAQYKEMKHLLRVQNVTVRKTTAHPDFSVDMNTAWALVQAMDKECYRYSITNGFVKFDDFDSIHHHTPTAILKAAAMALGVYSE